MSFIQDYKKIQGIVLEELQAVKEEISSCVNDYENIAKYISAPSKLIRPTLTFLYLKSFGCEITIEQIKLQAIVELIHNASLMHDDVIDKSDIRRKNLSFNKQEGNHMAVIGGDFVLSCALNKLVKLNSIEILGVFSNTLNSMCKGEINQNASRFKIPSMEEYLEKTYNKTGILFESSLKSGLILAEQSVECSEFAKYFGIAFQIRDDILNITQNSQNGDIKNGIYTAPVIYSGNPNTPNEGIEKAKGLLENYIGKAKLCIRDLPDNEYKRALIELVEILNNE